MHSWVLVFVAFLVSLWCWKRAKLPCFLAGGHQPHHGSAIQRSALISARLSKVGMVLSVFMPLSCSRVGSSCSPVRWLLGLQSAGSTGWAGSGICSAGARSLGSPLPPSPWCVPVASWVGLPKNLAAASSVQAKASSALVSSELPVPNKLAIVGEKSFCLCCSPSLAFSGLVFGSDGEGCDSAEELVAPWRIWHTFLRTDVSKAHLRKSFCSSGFGVVGWVAGSAGLHAKAWMSACLKGAVPESLPFWPINSRTLVAKCSSSVQCGRSSPSGKARLPAKVDM